MAALWTILVVILLALIACFFILRYYVAQVGQRREVLLEALWDRRNRLPLFLECLPNEEVTALRAKTMSEAYPLKEKIGMERRCTELLESSFRSPAKNAASSQALVIALEQELIKAHEQIDEALNDYNYSVEQLRRMLRHPWFRIFTFSVNLKENAPLPSV